ncbi:hypothetical protein C6364_08505 [Lactobacillus delbrueckii]|mgnify:FL=1|nr:acyltransferase family protein [Lactobacillus delbrueckii]AYC66862.1 hypothetical protein D4Z81_06015 [Lactobacillus delbrueckii subsp. bulgaricus]MCD5449532.1 acyltransferase family protein [Lactobacillus delbrueckii subsp. bulgaricus]MCD5464148.1 acyltransferase family protein [Lactobacillus delbrueckii subsp. bulgaricus]MCD5473852.1 acyltransferase family protein [Lactobacillus delbrueckii subsp. bulgaricus]MEC3724583.1 acyltransferase family protein [Lactobacillus delbrueckii subsp. bul
MANRQTTYKGVDVLKLLAAIGVVGIHVDAHYSPLIGRLAVPCFLLISGIFFFRKYDFLDEESKTRYLNSYLKRLGMLYLSWQILYLPFVVSPLIKYIHTHSNTLASYVYYVFRFFVPVGYTLSGEQIAGFNGWIQSWYLIALWVGIPIFRNNNAGYLIGKGKSAEEAKKEVGMVVEGINAIPAALELADKYDVEMPIVFAVDAVVNRGADARETVDALMLREKKSEMTK